MLLLLIKNSLILGTINDRDLRNRIEEKDDQLKPKEPREESEIRGYRAILLSPGRLVSLSRILAKAKLRGVKINNETGANAGKLLFRSISQNGIGRVLRFKRRNNIFVSSSQPDNN